MAMGLPTICPVLRYEKAVGYWACEQREEYETLKKAGWPVGFCNGAYTGRSVLLSATGSGSKYV